MCGLVVGPLLHELPVAFEQVVAPVRRPDAVAVGVGQGELADLARHLGTLGRPVTEAGSDAVQLVAGGQFRAGDLLPSVGAAAAELGINPMTVSKAYSLLERDGGVVRRPGLGMAVAE